jgi:hypothetical protein
VVSEISSRVDAIESDRTGLDLDLLADSVLEMPVRSTPALDLESLDAVLRRPDAMPPAVIVRGLGAREYGYLAPGMRSELRVTTDADFFEQHADSLELWSQGSPLFPDTDATEDSESPDGASIAELLQRHAPVDQAQAGLATREPTS